jgi:HlyD family secretion protein
VTGDGTPPVDAPEASAPEVATDLATLLGESPPRPWYRRPLPWIVAVLVLATGAGLWWWRAARAAEAAPGYRTQPASRGDLTLRVSANGTLQPTRTISIGSELSGTVREVHVDVNDRVTRGQVLAVLDTAKLKDQVLRSTAGVASARGRLAQAEATATETGRTLERLEGVSRLSGGTLPSKAEMDAARASARRAEADRDSARAGVADAGAGRSTDRTNLAKASIVAPTDGIVLTRSVDPGNAVAASLQAVTLFTVAEDLSRLRLWVYVDEADVGAVQVGQAATFTVSAWPSREFPARITRVGFGSTITDNVVTYLTYLDVDNTDLSLRPGMTATASIVASQRRDVLRVPNTALRFTPTAVDAKAAPRAGMMSGLGPRMPASTTRRSAAAGASTAGARQVWVLSGPDGGAPMAVAVVPGISDGLMTEIVGGDLREGMRVITDQKKAGAP